jgi:F0F1-type ATP synthase delta subunit
MDAEHIDGWAAALLEIARTERALSTVEEELFRFARTLEGSDELRGVLVDPAVPGSARAGCCPTSSDRPRRSPRASSPWS